MGHQVYVIGCADKTCFFIHFVFSMHAPSKAGPELLIFGRYGRSSLAWTEENFKVAKASPVAS